MTYILLILTTSLTSNFAQYLVSGPLFGGMSGVLYGLFGYIWIRGWREPDVPYKQPKIFIIITLVGLGLCWTGLLGNIANTAHIVGLLTGMIWAYFATSASMRRADYNYRHSDL